MSRRPLDEALDDWERLTLAPEERGARMLHAAQVGDPAEARQQWQEMGGVQREERIAAFAAALKAAALDPRLLRWCDWPGCPQSLQAINGPVAAGWHRHGGLLLCAVHHDSGHLVSHRPHPQQPYELLVDCACGTSGSVAATADDVAHWWREHVAALAARTTG